MRGTVLGELFLLVLNFGLGCLLGLFSDVHLVLRRGVSSRGRLLTPIADLLFWGWNALFFFCFLIVAAGGELRFSNLLLLPLGMALYFRKWRPRLRPGLEKWLDKLACVAGRFSCLGRRALRSWGRKKRP